MYTLSQILAFVSLVCLCSSLWTKNKDKLLTLQIIEPLINSIVNLILNAYSGVVCSIIAIFRNIFCKLHINKNILLCLCLILYLSYSIICVNTVVELLPVIGSIIYSIIVIKSEKMQSIRTGLIINSILWFIYDWIFMNYISVIKDTILILNGLISLVMHKTTIVIKRDKVESVA